MAAGSHATWSPKDSRVCFHCGQPLRITKDTLWIHTNDLTGEHTSSHTSCGPPWKPKERL